MEVRHEDRRLERLESDEKYTGGFGSNVVKAYRRQMNFIRNAVDERDFYAMKSLHFEKLAGDRAGKHSIRLNDQFRLVFRIERIPSKTIVIIEILDYH
ncbi:MAG: type II toxin-antitoxin system RelE/ParE family toxin [Tepidisphaeraceae bacterium]|jgi:proteic killer suppression protein